MVIKLDSENRFIFRSTVSTAKSDAILAQVKVDTGCNFTTIGQGLLPTQQLKALKFNQSAGTAGSDIEVANTRLRFMSFGLKASDFVWLYDIPVKVHPLWVQGSVKATKILLGMDVLSRFHLEFNPKRKELSMQLATDILPKSKYHVGLYLEELESLISNQDSNIEPLGWQ